jgi:solute carrier family 25, member 33/36
MSRPRADDAADEADLIAASDTLADIMAAATETEQSALLITSSSTSTTTTTTTTSPSPSSTTSSVTTSSRPKSAWWVPFVAGGIGGTLGAVLTCPLEVVKTRLQASRRTPPLSASTLPASAAASSSTLASASPSLLSTSVSSTLSTSTSSTVTLTAARPGATTTAATATTAATGDLHGMSLRAALRRVWLVEGPRGLWRGLGPNLLGVAPARAVYFAAYVPTKQAFEQLQAQLVLRPEDRSPVAVQAAAAVSAGIATALATNPLWLIKTRLQLADDATARHQAGARAAAARPAAGGTWQHMQDMIECARTIHRTEGWRGFYRGMSASFMGVSESTLQIVLYEHLLSRVEQQHREQQTLSPVRKYADFVLAASAAKLVACVTTYPHGARLSCTAVGRH